MINVNKGKVELEGDMDVLASEASVVLRTVYFELVDAIDKDFADMWIEDLPRTIRMTKEELIEEIWKKMLEVGDDECLER